MTRSPCALLPRPPVATPPRAASRCSRRAGCSRWPPSTPPTDGASTSTVPPTGWQWTRGVFRLKYGSTTISLTPCALHVRDELDDVRRRRRNARLRLDVADHVQAPALHEVRPGPVIGHELRARVRRHLGVPSLFRGRETLVEIARSAASKYGAVGRRERVSLSRIARAISRPLPGSSQ